MAQAEPGRLPNSGDHPLERPSTDPTAPEAPPLPSCADTYCDGEAQHLPHIPHDEDADDQADQEDTVSSTATQQSHQTIAQNNLSSAKSLHAPPSVWKQWWGEVLCCFLMMGMLGAMVGILYHSKDKPLPDWPYRTSANTVISILSAVLKACAAFVLAEGISDSKWKWYQANRSLHDLVVFDNASRGPWGCFTLLMAPRGLHPIPSLGAALVVLTLVLDPFTQQLIHYYDCRQVSTKLHATLPRSTMYCETTQALSATTPPPAELIGFIDQGLFNPTDIKTPFVCTTGNCTFDHFFSTLGFCSTREDMSSQLTFTNGAEYPDWVITMLPSGLSTSTKSGRLGPDEDGRWFVVNSTTDGWFEVLQVSKASPGAMPDWLDDHFYSTGMRENAYGSNGCETPLENNTWACSGFGGAGATRCRLDPCIKTYRASVEQGVLHEHLVHSQLKMFATEHSQDVSAENSHVGWYSYWLAADLTCAGPDAVSRLQGAGFRVGANDTIIPWSVRVNGKDARKLSLWEGRDDSVPGPPFNETGLPLDIIPVECLYSMCYDPGRMIIRYLRGYLEGAIGGCSSFGPPPLRALYHDTYASFDSINQIFASIAEGITQRVRRHGQPGALPVPKPAVGVVFEQKTCVSVRWPYLAFPAAVVALTTIFIIGVIGIAAVSTASAATAGWKSSPLPMVFHGLKTDVDAPALETTHGSAGFAPSLHDMEKVAKTATARLNM